MISYKKTTIGAVLLLLLFLASYLYPFYGPADFNKGILAYDENHNVIGKAPFSPSSEHILGTDRNGQDMHLLLLYGAKYTLMAAVTVALLRAILGGVAGVFLTLYTPCLKKYFKDFFIIFRYIPSIFLCLILMGPVVGSFEKPLDSVVVFQIIILVFMGFPTVAIFTSELTDELMGQSFIKSSFLMGANKFQVLRTHLLPYFKSYGILLVFQQLLSTLQLTMHLGIFGFFLGGETIGGTFGYEEPPKPASLTNEWAGLVGQNFQDFIRAPWVIFVPIIGYLVVILIINMMKKELEENMNGKLAKRKYSNSSDNDTSLAYHRPTADQFVFAEVSQQKSAETKPHGGAKRRVWGKMAAVVAVICTLGVITLVETKEKVESKTEEKPEVQIKPVSANVVPPLEKQTKEEEKKVYSIGQEIKLASSTLTVPKVEKSQGNIKEKPKSGNEFIIVTVQISNTGTENLKYSPDYFNLLNQKGDYIFQPYLTIDIDTTLSSGELAPGEVISGTLAFEQPIGEPLQLQYSSREDFSEILVNLQ
ncbi:DUF4352 domain-containing protein [Neobacillus dielmonensis]|uniref:DUF4352 domain-containing protein n=1 Tax=Neobacillus dielmonensis TaxID=1347369 RepID=UPI0005A7AA7A|nr:DUF4352 domain-containing protein [Neobacillus dielmonensis]